MENGRFRDVGTSADVLETVSEGDETADLDGKFVCAGFNDSHMHLLNYGYALNSVMLGGHTGSVQEIIDEISRFIAGHDIKEGEWVTAKGWNQDYFTGEKKMPDRWDLDRASLKNPVIAYRCCEHCIALNSRALEILGINENTECPEGGEIGRSNGVLNGLFFDNAIRNVTDCLPPPPKETIKKYITDACRSLNSYGVTSCQTDDYQTFGNISWRTVNEAYHELEEEGLLSVRVYEQCNFTAPDELREFISEGNYTGKGTDRFKIGPLKIIGDGSLGARTAYLSAPYEDKKDETGLALFTQEKLDEMICFANSHGMNVAVHAIGDGCLDMVLSAIEKALKECPRNDHRHGIVHCQVTRPEQLEKIASLGLHVYAQTVFLDYDNHMVESRIGRKRAETSYSWKTLMNMGVTVSNGSDCPVELPDAFRGIQCAVTRCSTDGTGPYLPAESFSVAEAIDSYTVCGARASFEESYKGKISSGYLADFIICDADPFEIPADKIAGIAIIR